MRPDPGQVAYEARMAGFADRAPPWAAIEPEIRTVWAGVEAAVLASAHRLQVVEEAWDAKLSHHPAVVALAQAAGRVVALTDQLAGHGKPAGVPSPIVLATEQPPPIVTLSISADPAIAPETTAALIEAAKAAAPMLADHASARIAGFTGNVCGACGALAMVRDGKCEKCTVCGTTSGGCA